MAISGVGQNFYRNNVETKGNTKNVNNTEKFALEKTGSTRELSENKNNFILLLYLIY